MRFTPPFIASLLPGEVFVFGSNLLGHHGTGAAKMAVRFGARHGVGVGPCGRTYAIPTKREAYVLMELSVVQAHIRVFLAYAALNRHQTFLVTEVGCGRAGFTPAQIAPTFFERPLLNVVLPTEFHYAAAACL